MAASYLVENAISVKNSSEVVRCMSSLLRDLTWPGHNFFAKSCAKDAPLPMQNLSAIRQALRGPFKKKLIGVASPPPPGRRGWGKIK